MPLQPFQRGDRLYTSESGGDRLYTSESDVCGRQILTYKDGPHTEKFNKILMAVDPQQRYSNKAGRVS